jgi:DNA-directed RNA polymerase specialized sigma24 family protein
MNWEKLKNEPTEDLTEIVKFKEDPDYLADAKDAFTVLTFRFRKDLIDKCTMICRKWGYKDDEVAVELAYLTFERYWKYPFSFEKKKCNVSDTDQCFKFYLYSIAQNELKRLNSEKLSPYDGSERLITSLIDNEKEYEPEKLRELKKAEEKLDKALSKLTPKHKIIFLTYKAYEEDGHKLPRELLKELRESLNLTQNSIRVYKKQAFEAVEKRLNK